MPKDPLLTEKFFSLERTASEIALDQQELTAIDQLIKQKLYPHLSTEQSPSYYQGAHNPVELNSFIYSRMGADYTTEFINLCKELKLTIRKLQSWAETNQIAEATSLADFYLRLSHPTEEILVMYTDGKRWLEKLAVLLDDTDISLENRKKVVTNLLADRELEQCINGCYSRITSAALQLQEQVASKNQIKLWLRSYAQDMARHVAAQRPFAMPETYQEMLCRASDSSVDQNMLHASNYLLMQAKEHGFPMDIPMDPGAVELGRGLSAANKAGLLKPYIDVLEQHISAKNLVNYLSNKLHEHFQSVMLRDIAYVDKTQIILDKLNLLGEDSWFKTNKVGLDEIFSEMDGNLKDVTALTVTVTERLIHSGLLPANEMQTILLSDITIQYRGFSSSVELMWFWIDEERKPLLQLIKQDRLPELVPLLRTLFIKNMEDLLLVVKSLPRKHDVTLFNEDNMRSIIFLIHVSDSPQLFTELLLAMPVEYRLLLLKQCSDTSVRNIISKALRIVDFRSVFLDVSVSYAAEDYDVPALQEGLSVTKQLIKLVIDNQFKNFNGIFFAKLDHLNYLQSINFSRCNLKAVIFFQEVNMCWFEEAELQGAKFFAPIKGILLRKTDLRQVDFRSHIHPENSLFILDQARLSTASFKALVFSYTVDFTGTDLKEVNFQDIAIKNILWKCDFVNADLSSVDLNGIDLGRLSLRGANLENANLVLTKLLRTAVDAQTNFKASQLALSAADYAYHQGVRNFDHCKIYLDIVANEEWLTTNFQQTSFKKAEFIGKNLYVDFIDSDLNQAVFRPEFNMREGKEEFLTLELKASKTQLNGVLLHQVQFTEGCEFTDSTVKDLRFVNVKMQAKTLFTLYAAGQRDFSGIEDLKGTIPHNLLPFPVLEAQLSKKAFIHLYKQGLRDFRGSNLNSFYLGQVLSEQAIAEIDLKLGGARYRRVSLGCLPHTRRKRNVLHRVANCVMHVLLQKEGSTQEKKLVLADIESLAKASDHSRYVLKETSLTRNNLFDLAEVKEVNCYLGYQADDRTLVRTFLFIRDSTAASAREHIQIRFYLFQRFNDNRILIEFTRNLAGIGFSDVKANYYNSRTEFYAVYFKNDAVSVAAARQLVSAKLAFFLHEDSFDPVKAQIRESSRDRLRRISLDIKRQVGSGVRAAGRKGAQYQIGAGIIQLIAHAINQPDTVEPKLLDTQTKESLSVFARNFTVQRGRTRGASDRLIATVSELTKRCIDRGECSNEELVMRESIHFMDSARPNLVVGNEYMWGEIKGFFINIGDYLSDKFDEVKSFFNRDTPQLAANNSFLEDWGLGIATDVTASRRVKRNIYTWFQFPTLMRLIKEIESAFDALAYDLQLDDRYSEEVLAGILFDIWQGLAQRNISSHSTPTMILSILNHPVFIEEMVNKTVVANVAYPNMTSNKTLNVSYTRAIDAIDDASIENLTIQRKRIKRSLGLSVMQQMEQAKTWDIEEQYHAKFSLKYKASQHKCQAKSAAKLDKITPIEQVIKQKTYPVKPKPLMVTEANAGKKSIKEKNKYSQQLTATSYAKKYTASRPYFFLLAKKNSMLHPKTNYIQDAKLVSYLQYQQPTVSKQVAPQQTIDIPRTLFLLNTGISCIREKYHPLSIKESYLQQHVPKQIQKK